MSAIAPIPSGEAITTKRESTLRYLELLRHEVTGLRGLAKPSVDPGMATTMDAILEEVAVEAYFQVLNHAWRVVPGRFFRMADPAVVSGVAAGPGEVPGPVVNLEPEAAVLEDSEAAGAPAVEAAEVLSDSEESAVECLDSVELNSEASEEVDYY